MDDSAGDRYRDQRRCIIIGDGPLSQYLVMESTIGSLKDNQRSRKALLRRAKTDPHEAARCWPFEENIFSTIGSRYTLTSEELARFNQGTENALAPSTTQSYQAILSNYQVLSKDRGFTPFPLVDENAIQFVMHQTSKPGHRAISVKIQLAALARVNRDAGFDTQLPLARKFLVGYGKMQLRTLEPANRARGIFSSKVLTSVVKLGLLLGDRRFLGDCTAIAISTTFFLRGNQTFRLKVRDISIEENSITVTIPPAKAGVTQTLPHIRTCRKSKFFKSELGDHYTLIREALAVAETAGAAPSAILLTLLGPLYSTKGSTHLTSAMRRVGNSLEWTLKILLRTLAVAAVVRKHSPPERTVLESNFTDAGPPRTP